MKIISQKIFNLSSNGKSIPVMVRKNKQSKNYKLTFDKKNLRGFISIPRHITFIDGINFAKENKKWLFEQYNENHPVLYINQGTEIPFENNIKKIIFLNENKNHIYATDDNIIVINNNGNHKKKLEAWMRNRLLSKASQIIKEVSITFGVKTKNIKLSNSFSSWGSCNSNKDISINWRLIFAPQEILKYIIVHEICHLIEFNHGKKFWSLVSKACPEKDNAIKWLKKNENDLYKIRFN